MDFINNIDKHFTKYLDKYQIITPNISWMPQGILPSEGFAMCAMSDIYNIDIMIESGVRYGRSTQIWAEYMENISIKAIDIKIDNKAKDRLSKYSNVELIEEDSVACITDIISNNADKKIGIFIDGPKGEKAIDMAKSYIENENTCFIGVHDMHRLRLNGNIYECRTEIEQLESFILSTDEEWFINKYSFLDNEESSNTDILRDIRWIPYKYVNGKGEVIRELGSYGPTICFIGKNI